MHVGVVVADLQPERVEEILDERGVEALQALCVALKGHTKALEEENEAGVGSYTFHD